MEVKLVTTQRGFPSLLVGEFRFAKKEAWKTGKTKWECEKRRSCGCQAKCFTVGDSLELQNATLVHNHEPDLKKYVRQAISNACKRKAEEDLFTKPSELMASVISSTTDIDIDANISRRDVDRIRTNLRNKRKRILPTLPGTYRNTSGDIDNFLKQLEQIEGVSKQLDVVEQEASLLRWRMRERCLKEPTKPLRDIIWDTLAGCSAKVRDHLSKIVDAIERDMSNVRTMAANAEFQMRPQIPSDDGDNNFKSKRAKTEGASCDTLPPPVSCSSRSSLQPSPAESTEKPNPYTPHDNVIIKDELILEDYGNADNAYKESVERIPPIGDLHAKPSISEDLPGQFETIICGNDVQVKQEVVEDESDLFEMPQDFCVTSMTEDPCQTFPTAAHFQPPPSSGPSSNFTPARLTDRLDPSTNSIQGVNNSKYPVAAPGPGPSSIPLSQILSRISKTTSPYVNSACATATSVTNPTKPPIPSAPSTSVSASATNLPVALAVSGSSPPHHPPHITSHVTGTQDLEGVYLSLKNVPKERRKKTLDKVLRLIKLITELDLDPDEVSFSVTTK